MGKFWGITAFTLGKLIEACRPSSLPIGHCPNEAKIPGDDSLRRDEVVSDARCLERCNNRLNVGMDMVNAHMSFGSIDVPSVVEQHDLELFCLLDRQHSQCVDECGYAVQFNLREYVCKRRFNEMLEHLPCYARAAPVLSRHCRPRCGEYTPLQHTLPGYAQR
ncbi:hypothetical protein ANCCEY_02338 [Ancylostoma ceylanicum]|uniref:Chondroitin proteoglycan 4 domain-containing protein n=1 Tax=Ancylostoma ceylanicum TaxID=53326 RepID=A0A0D6M531_9BILA|nr:hypothetical protein ANCCEY_02338 [Ancylostoma ceylanicum]